MTSTLIPLSRGAMLDLEALMNGLTDSLNDASTSTSSVCWSPRTGFPATPMSGCSHSPANQPATAKPMRAGYGAASAAASTEAAPPHTHSVKVPPLLSVEVLTAANGVAGSSANADRAQLASDHPALVGGFVDVFRDPFTTSWRLIDKMLYLVWWAYCPRSCVECGLQEAWIPSADCGMKCRGCGRGGRLLETKTAVENSHDDSGDEGEDDAMEQPDDGAAGADAGVEHSLLRGTVQSFMTFHKVVDCIGDLLPGYACTTSGEDNDQDHAFLPRGKELAVVFRAAHDLASLIALPGLPITALPMVQHTALYLSLVLHRFVVPFPLFVLAVQYSGEAAAGSRRRKQSNKHAPGVLDCTAEYVVQWVDVEHAAEQLGINLADFFEAPQVSAQYLQNVMTVARDYAVPSVLWRLDRVPGRVSYVSGLQTKRREVMPGCTGLSPEHTAILVALELARQLDESPMTTTFIEDEEAASRQAVRLGKWLKDLGMYPTCDFYSGENSSGTAATADPTYQRLVELVSGPSGRDRRNAKDEEVRNMLTTPASSFAGSMELVLASPCANALLHLFAQVFQIPVLELAELALHSGIYQGPSFFVSILERSMMEGRYSIMPLVRRISPLVSPWKAVYDALHSQDRLPLITALQLLRRNENSYGPNFHLLTRALHTLLAPHQVGPIYQFNYALLVSGEVFVLTSVVANGVAVFMNVPACTKTISFNAHNRRISVCESNGHSGAPGSGVEKVVDRLDAIFHPPVVVHAVGESVRCIAEVIRCGSTEVTGSSGVDQWKKAVALMEACGRLRRQMRVPILAARLEAVSSIRSSRATSSWGGADVGLTASPSAALIGWGSVDTALTTAMHVDVCRIRAEIQETVCNLPSASLLLGLSDERVVCLYTSLVSLLEFLVSKLAAQEEQQQASADAQDRVPLSWVEELLFVEEDDEDDDDGFPMNSQGSGYAFNRSPRQRPMPMRGSHRSGRTRSPERRGAMALLNSPPQFAKMTPVMKPKSSGVTISSLPMLDELDELPPMALDSSAADVKEESAPMHVDAQKEADALHALVLQHMPPPPPYEEVLCGARRKEKRGNKADMESASRPAEVADFAVFGLRNAQECRRRLQRIYAFLVQYKTKKASLYRKFQSAGAGGSTSRRRSSNSPPQDQVRGVGTKSPGKGSPQVHPSPVEVSVRQPRKKTGRRRRRHANDAQWLAEHGGRDEDSSVSAGSSRGSSSERERVEADPPQGRSPPRTPTMEPRRAPGRGGKRKRGDETQ